MNTNYLKDFVPHEPSLALKELGFDEPCFGYYKPNGELDYIENHILKDFPYLAKNSEWQDLVAAPTFSQAFRWFREKYDLKSFIQPLKNDDDIDIYVFAYGIEEIEHNDLDYLIHEEAELACLIKLIEIVKNK
jgi:hypothetical protein